MRALLKKSSITSRSSAKDLISDAQKMVRNSERTDYKQVVRAERISKDDPIIKIILGKKM